MSGNPQYEGDFVVIDKKEYEKIKGDNLYEDLVNMWFISEEDYENASPEVKKRYDELKEVEKEDVKEE